MLTCVIHTGDEIRKYVTLADELCTKVDGLEELVKQMDEWSSELVVKMKRLER